MNIASNSLFPFVTPLTQLTSIWLLLRRRAGRLLRPDRLGRMVSAVTAVLSNLFEYAGLDLAGEIQDGVAITRSYDGLGRSTGFNIGDTYSTAYGYDDFGRFCSVSSSVCSVCSVVSYSCLPGADLVASMTNSAGFRWQRTYEQKRDLIDGVENGFNGSTVSDFAYGNDALGRRTNRVDSLPSLTVTNAFGYTMRSEVTRATMGEDAYSYEYDPIGNRIYAAFNAGTNAYTANALNQYTSISNFVPFAPSCETNPEDDIQKKLPVVRNGKDTASC